MYSESFGRYGLCPTCRGTGRVLSLLPVEEMLVSDPPELSWRATYEKCKYCEGKGRNRVSKLSWSDFTKEIYHNLKDNPPDEDFY